MASQKDKKNSVASAKLTVKKKAATTPPNSAPPSKITYAAGGILWRTSKRGRQVLLIMRPKYHDWTLPKGHIEKTDDGWDAAAQREVKEETGYDTVITGFAGHNSYEVKGRPKVVLYWHMAPVGIASFEPSDEVTGIAWFPLAEAIEKLTYEKDKALLRQFLKHE